MCADALEAKTLAYLAGHYGATTAEPLSLPCAEVFSVIGGEGTPQVSDFLVLELAAARGTSTMDAAEALTAVVNLKYRHPMTYKQVLNQELPLWIAKRAAQHCADLPLEACKWVDARWSLRQAALPTARKFRLLKGLITSADPAAAAERLQKARAERFVTTGHHRDGTIILSAKLDTLDGLYLDAAADRIADILISQGTQGTKKTLRATALGILATPARALSLLQAAAQQPALDDEERPTECGYRDPGHTCGTITVNPDQLLPKATIVLHVGATPDGELSPTVRLNDTAPLPLDTLRELLGDVRVTIRPVIDLNETPAIDRYEIPERIRTTVHTRWPYDTFPWSNRSSRTLDLDHAHAWSREGPPGQTSVDNLRPLNRRAHRAKTSGVWNGTIQDKTSSGPHPWATPTPSTPTAPTRACPHEADGSRLRLAA